jgi:5-methylcytosine-specific restriction endonuclease McrA
MSNPALKPFYNSAAWKRARLAAFERDDYHCRICGKLTSKPTGHHYPPIEELLRRGLDPLDLAYIFTACPPCHGEEDGPRSHAPKPPKVNRFKRWL